MWEGAVARTSAFGLQIAYVLVCSSASAFKKECVPRKESWQQIVQILGSWPMNFLIF